MQLPFTTEQFFEVFREYNTAVWPIQFLLFGLAFVATVMVVFPRRWSGVGVSAILAGLWTWLGIAYHLAFFTAINPLAYGFAALSFLGSLVLLWQGVVRRKLEFRLTRSTQTVIGILLVIFALAIYPAWSAYSGHHYPELPTFGLPCPTTIFTIGLFAFLVRPYPRSPLVIPVLWSLVGGQAAFQLGVPQDSGLLVAGVVGLVLIVQANKAASS
jgi:hypothetical protein